MKADAAQGAPAARNEDIYHEMAESLFRVQAQEVTDEMRERAKTIGYAHLFSAPYGQGGRHGSC